VLLDQLIEEYGSSVALIRYYTSGYNDPFHSYNTLEIDARRNYYGNFYSPQLIVDGFIDCGPAYANWEDSIVMRFSVESPLEINLSGNYEPETRTADLNISITATDVIDYTDLTMQCALVENGIYYTAPNGVKYHSQVLRDFIPTADGELMEISYGETLDFVRNTVIDTVLADDSCEFVVFVQDNATHEILQSKTLKIPDMQSTPDISIVMIPENSPVIVPAGGSFTYAGILTNQTDQPQTTDVVVVIEVPDYGFYGPVARYNNVELAPWEFINVEGIVQHVPVNTPLGLYKYYAFCGDFPDQATDSNFFQFEVIAPQYGDAQEWAVENFFEDTETIASGISLYNSPNPFNAKTSITYQLREVSHITLDIYNILGQRVVTLVDETQEPGYHTINWDATTATSGVYFYKMTTGNNSLTKRMILLK